jgi:hypothetical protein
MTWKASDAAMPETGRPQPFIDAMLPFLDSFSKAAREAV